MPSDEVGSSINRRRASGGGRSETLREGQRFSELISRVIRDQDTKQYAILFGVSETTIRNWTVPGASGAQTVPSKTTIKDVLEKLDLPSDVLSYMDAEWRKFIAGFDDRTRSVSAVIKRPNWLYFAENLASAEAHLERGTFAILITADAYNDTHRKETWELVRTNLRKGVRYIYVVPQHCRYGNTLSRNVMLVRRELASHPESGSVQIMTVPTTSERSAEWTWIDHVFLFMDSSVEITPQNIGDVEPSMIARGFEQIYRAGDRPTGDGQAIAGYIWAVTTERKEILYCNLLQAWAEKAEWS